MTHPPHVGTDTGTDAIHWAQLASVGAPYEAELARQQLEAEGIPVAVLNDGTGIFGPGFMGAQPRGVRILVPSDRLEEARELIEDLVEAWGGTLSGDEEA